jgi:rhamnose utilization protein RhaD (predicted bifunctional aldolase and dehydrogenase)
MLADHEAELHRLRELTARVGNDPLLTQASTGNCSTKLDDVLWIKASGKWMADAMRDDILIPLDLTDGVMQCLLQGIDPVERYPNASLETAAHAALPHRVVLHVHSINTIAWAVREDALFELQLRLAGLRWQWIDYTASGLPLSRKIEDARRAFPDTDLFVLGNHGLIVGGQRTAEVEDLLMEVERRLAVPPRRAKRADYPSLETICAEDPKWVLPDDDDVHALGTDSVSRAIIAGGLLYPCQAVFSDTEAAKLFRAIPFPADIEHCWNHYRERTFLIIEDRGVVLSKSVGRAELAMLSGLAQVVQRLSSTAPLRYLTESEIAGISGEAANRYRNLANTEQGRGPGEYFLQRRAD